MNKFIHSWIYKRTLKLPMVELTAHPFMTVGAIFGGAIGFTSSLRNQNGPIWRTTMGTALGGSMG